MKKEGFILIFIILAVANVLAVESCGDYMCNAGLKNYNENYIEDASTCYKDCMNTDYEYCVVDDNEGGECNFMERNFKISEITKIGCWPIDAAFFLARIETPGYNRGIRSSVDIWTPIIDEIYMRPEKWSCNDPGNKTLIVFKKQIKLKNLNYFLELKKEVFNKEKDNFITISYDFPVKLSMPYCQSELLSKSTGKVIEKDDQLGCKDWKISLASIEPGTYSLKSEYYDQKVESIIGEQTKDIIINECSTNEDCKGVNILTTDSCVGDSYKVCEHETNSTIIVIAIVAIIAVIVIALLLAKGFFKKKNVKKK